MKIFFLLFVFAEFIVCGLEGGKKFYSYSENSAEQNQSLFVLELTTDFKAFFPWVTIANFLYRAFTNIIDDPKRPFNVVVRVKSSFSKSEREKKKNLHSRFFPQ